MDEIENIFLHALNNIFNDKFEKYANELLEKIGIEKNKMGGE